MSFIIIPSLREKLGLNISSSELKKLDVKSVRNVDILRLKQTLIRSLNIQKREVIATFLAKLATPQKLLLPRPRLKPQLQHEVLPLHLALSSHVDSINIRHPETISQLKEEAKAGKYEKINHNCIGNNLLDSLRAKNAIHVASSYRTNTNPAANCGYIN